MNPAKATSSVTTEAFTASRTESPNITISTTLDDVEAAYKKSIETLIANLEEQEQQLNAELDRVVSDLARAREKLTKFGGQTVKATIKAKGLRLVISDLPTSHMLVEAKGITGKS